MSAELRETPYNVPGEHRVAVVDIGSNSVRMVVFEGLSRALVPLFNEKAMCALGRGLGETGELSVEGIERALRTLRRFRVVGQGLNVSEWFVIATAAARDASNGAEFIAQAETALGVSIRILSGHEEAAAASLGVAGSIRNAKGYVGDLGGGSLDMGQIKGLQVGACASFKLGPFHLQRLGAATSKSVIEHVDDTFAACEWLQPLEDDEALYVVGGAWRTLGRINIAQSKYPLKILHQYEMPAGQVRELANAIARMDADALSGVDEVSSRRIDTMAHGAMVLDRLIEKIKPRSIVFSAHGLREGLLYEQLSNDELALDPLISNAKAMAVQFDRPHLSQIGQFADELYHWASPLFEDETFLHARRRYAATILSDIAWRTPTDYRGAEAFNAIMHGPLVGVRHVARAQIGLSVAYRYAGSLSGRDVETAAESLPDETQTRAKRVGLALRLGITLAGSLPGVLPECPLEVCEERIRLRVPEAMADFVGEVTETRLNKIASYDKKKALIELF